VAGALSSTPERARASGAGLGLADDRNHGSWQELLADELRRPAGERIDIVVIVTPNHLHHDVAHAFVDAGFHVVCDKPLVHTSAQAEALRDLVAARGTLFAVTYNYTGYPMVREAKRAFLESWVSVSCHSLADVESARAAGADVCLFGPVFGKSVDGVEVVPGAGLEALRQACAAAGKDLPVFALGGVTEANSAACVDAGASGVAGIRMFFAAE